MTYALGLDIGTTNLKVLLLDVNGSEAFSLSRRNKVMETNLPGWAEFHPDFVYKEILKLIHATVDHVGNGELIRALCISSMGETGVLIDEKGKWVYPAIAWYDIRTKPQMQRWKENDDKELSRYQATGMPLSASYGLLKLMWLKDNRPEEYKQGKCWLPIGDYVAFRLCGAASTDRTQAWRTMAYDINAMNWSENILGDAEIESSKMPPIVPTGEPLGNISKKVADETGLGKKCVVVSGGMDAICGMIAVGAIQPNIVLDIIGTSEIILTAIKKPNISSIVQEASLDIGPHVLPGYHIAFGSLTASGSVIEWFIRLLSNNGDRNHMNDILEKLTRDACQLDYRSSSVMFLPHLNGSRTPHNDSSSRGSILGLSLDTTPKDIFLALLAGLCFESRLVSESLRKAFKVDTNHIWVSGGASKNELFMRLKADILNSEILIPKTDNLSAHGAAIIAAYGGGLYPSLNKAVDKMKTGYRKLCGAADKNKKWMKKYSQSYENLYPALKARNTMR